MTNIIVNVHSDALAGNPLGDPDERSMLVYLPPAYLDDARSLPVVFVLAGFFGSGLQFLNWAAFQKSLPQQLDDLAAADPDGGQFIAVFPDCFTSYGGSQYINSSAVGNYEDYLLELAAFVDATFRTTGTRGIVGHSSGGYGALVHGMRHPDVWHAVACRSGDMGFEQCYGRDFPGFCNTVSRAGGLEAWLPDVLARERKSGEDMTALSVFAMAACYSPDPARSPIPVALPVDLATCEYIPEVWARWLARDPLVLLEDPAIQAALRSLKLLFVECGRRDEYMLHFGARRFTRRLAQLGIAHEYDETDDGHMGTSYRYAVSFAKLAGVLG